MAKSHQDAEAQWWAEDAARYNAMGDAARALGVTVSVGATQPALNPDGSLAEESPGEEGGEDGGDEEEDPLARFSEALNSFCPTGVGGGVDPSCSPGGKEIGSKLSSGEVAAHIMATNPPEQVRSGRMTDKEWVDTYLSPEPDGYVVAKVHPAVMNFPVELGKPEHAEAYSKKEAKTSPPIVVDSNEKMQSRYGGGKLERAYGILPHVVVDGKHRVAAALKRGDDSITAIVPARKAEEIRKQSHALELSEFAHKYAADKGHTITKEVQETHGPRVHATTKEGYERSWGPYDLEKIAGKVGHQFKYDKSLASNAADQPRDAAGRFAAVEEHVEKNTYGSSHSKIVQDTGLKLKHVKEAVAQLVAEGKAEEKHGLVYPRADRLGGSGGGVSRDAGSGSGARAAASAREGAGGLLHGAPRAAAPEPLAERVGPLVTPAKGENPPPPRVATGLFGGATSSPGSSGSSESRVGKVASAFLADKGAKYNLVDVAALSKATGHTHEEVLDTVRHMVGRGLLYTQAYEGRHGLTPDQQAVRATQVKHTEDLSDPQTHIGYVSTTDEGKLRAHAVHNSFCPTGEGGGVDPSCSSSTSPQEDHGPPRGNWVAPSVLPGPNKGALPPAREWVDPPLPTKREGAKAGGVSAVAGMTNTHLGDLAEHVLGKSGGYTSLLPPGVRQNPLDTRWDTGDQGFEVKAVSTSASEYKSAPKKEEVASKLAYAAQYGYKANLLIAVVDIEAKQIHTYMRTGTVVGSLYKHGKVNNRDFVHLGTHSFDKDDVEATRPKTEKATRNVFCSTGEGGGVDPSCSPGGKVDLPKTAKAAGEAMADALASVDKERFAADPGLRDKVSKNWAKQLRGKVVASGADFDALQEGLRQNASSPLFQEIQQVHGRQAVVLLNGEGLSRRAESIGPSIHVYSHKIEPLEAKDVKPTPGAATSEAHGGVAAVLRHEYAHRVLNKLPEESKRQWAATARELYPEPDDLKSELTNYAGREASKSTSRDEVFTEAFAIGTSRHYDPSQFTARAQRLIRSVIDVSKEKKS